MLNSFFDKFVFTNGLKYTHYNFYLMNVPFSIIPVDILIGLALVKEPEANQKLYSAVKKHISSSLVQAFQLESVIGKSVLFLEEFFTASGWGLVSHLDLNESKKRAIILVEDNPVARALHGKTTKPVDHVFRGVLAGVFSRLFKTDVDCVENACIALGHGRCEFLIKPQQDFDFSKQSIREQLPLEESIMV